MDRDAVLETANAYITADRQTTYGTPERNFETIAELWSTYLTAAQQRKVEIAPYEVAVMMSLVKVARLATSPQKADNWIDLAGYAACGAEVSNAE